MRKSLAAKLISQEEILERRDLVSMRKEAIKVAAMAIRFAHELCTEERGHK